jgi:nucleotide-binding universal stress UspA family protein
MKYILCCVDGKNYSEAVCDYAVMIANNMKLPIKILNVVEHKHTSEILDLSGNIKLGEKDDILEALTQEEAIESKSSIKAGRELLLTLKMRASASCNHEILTSLVHGDIIENIIESQDEIEVLVIGINSNKEQLIGTNVKDIIKSIHKPVLLVNNEFISPRKILIAYNGSTESKKLLTSTANNPIFTKEIHRDIVNLNTNKQSSSLLLKEAKEIFAKNDIMVNTESLEGESEDLIVEYFAKNESDILAMGAFGHSWIKELVFGSFTSKILSKMKKPILLFR